jgi:hypothetical protein
MRGPVRHIRLGIIIGTVVGLLGCGGPGSNKTTPGAASAGGHSVPGRGGGYSSAASRSAKYGVSESQGFGRSSAVRYT